MYFICLASSMVGIRAAVVYESTSAWIFLQTLGSSAQAKNKETKVDVVVSAPASNKVPATSVSILVQNTCIATLLAYQPGKEHLRHPNWIPSVHHRDLMCDKASAKDEKQFSDETKLTSHDYLWPFVVLHLAFHSGCETCIQLHLEIMKMLPMSFPWCKGCR